MTMLAKCYSDDGGMFIPLKLSGRAPRFVEQAADRLG